MLFHLCKANFVESVNHFLEESHIVDAFDLLTVSLQRITSHILSVGALQHTSLLVRARQNCGTAGAASTWCAMLSRKEVACMKDSVPSASSMACADATTACSAGVSCCSAGVITQCLF